MFTREFDNGTVAKVKVNRELLKYHSADVATNNGIYMQHMCAKYVSFVNARWNVFNLAIDEVLVLAGYPAVNSPLPPLANVQLGFNYYK